MIDFNVALTSFVITFIIFLILAGFSYSPLFALIGGFFIVFASIYFYFMMEKLYD